MSGKLTLMIADPNIPNAATRHSWLISNVIRRGRGNNSLRNSPAHHGTMNRATSQYHLMRDFVNVGS